MGIVSSKCYYCGEPVQVDIQKDAWICPGCGEPFIVEKSIKLARKNKVSHKRVVVSPVRAGKSKTAGYSESTDEAESVQKDTVPAEEVIEEPVKTEETAEEVIEAPEISEESESSEPEETTKASETNEEPEAAELEEVSGVSEVIEETKAPEPKVETKIQEVKAESEIRKNPVSRPSIEIENGVFIKYSGTSDEIEIPHSVRRIGENAFEDCKTLKKVILPDGLVGIGG